MNWSATTTQLIRAAVEEDLATGSDVTSALLEDPHASVFAHVVPRANGVICGLALAGAICDEFSRRLGEAVNVTPWRREGATGSLSPARVHDGDAVHAGRIVAEVQGPRAAVLAVERTLLNFLGRMSGVATLTRRYVEAARAASATVKILDTRKTLPGWRELDKYAVRCGGGENHRSGLYDAVLIKDNHLSGVPTGQLAATLFAMLNRMPQPSACGFVEVEVDGLEQLREVCKVVGVQIVLIDNFSIDQMKAAVALRDDFGLRGKIALEASGGVTMENVGEIAATGVDRISIGALTHSAGALDIGLDFVS